LHCLFIDYHLERWEDAARLLEQQLAEDAFYIFRMKYISILAKLGEYDKLVAQLELLDESDGAGDYQYSRGLESLLLQVAWDLRDAGKDAEAEQIFRRLLVLVPENDEARNSILHLYSSEEERAAHRAALEASWQEEENHGKLAAEGANKLAGGDAAGAFELLQRAVAGLPDNEVAWFNCGLAAIQLEKWSDAERALARAIEINPSRAEAYLYRGAALQGLERCSEAIPLLDKAIALSSALTQTHFYLYFCHHALGNYEASEKHRKLYDASRGGG
jgi:tetratricopeptide (TPR) repeat protein